MRKISKYIFSLLFIFFVATIQSAWADGPPAPSIIDNSLAIMLFILMLLLMIVIGILGNILIGVADINAKKRKNEKKISNTVISGILLIMLMISPEIFAQNVIAETAVKKSSTIGGMDASAFYIMIIVIFAELLIILALLVNIKLLIRKEKLKIVAEEETAVVKEEKANRLSWWDRFNRLRPVTEEAELDLGHEYDGIRELNNRLPPWWLYGFYLCIIFAIVYMWRFHVSHSGPSSAQEYENSVAKAEIRIQNYLKLKGELVDENTVTLLTSEEDLAAGKAIFMNPSNCPACHNADGGGNAVGPNLTDDYWLYGGSVKDIFKTIKYGTNKGMRSWKDDLSAKQIAQVSSYVKSLQGTKPANPKEAQGELYKEELTPAPVKDSTIVAPETK